MDEREPRFNVSISLVSERLFQPGPHNLLVQCADVSAATVRNLTAADAGLRPGGGWAVDFGGSSHKGAP
jgi:hypothetical protein